MGENNRKQEKKKENWIYEPLFLINLQWKQLHVFIYFSLEIKIS